ncbi:MAG: response regulator [Planctomycetota bacterium]
MNEVAGRAGAPIMAAFRILVVDDEEETLRLYHRFLQSEEYEIVTAASPQTACELLRRECWDILISDICMPDLNGFDVMQAGKVNNPHIRCIAVTGYGTNTVLDQVLEHDCFGYINKPFDWDYLKLLIQKALHPLQARQNRASTRRKTRKRVRLPKD